MFYHIQIGNEAGWKPRTIGAGMAAFLVVAMMLGCSGSQPTGSNPTSTPQASPMLAPQFAATDPDLQRRIEEAKAISRERAKLPKKDSPSPTEKPQQPKVDPQVWLAEFEMLQDERHRRISPLIDEMGRHIQTYSATIPETQAARREEMLEKRNRFSISRGTEVPLYPELRQAGLDYVRRRLPVEKAYVHPLRRLAAQDFGGANLVHLEMVRKELAEVEKAVRDLEQAEASLTQLPEKSAEVAQALEEQPKGRDVSPMPAIDERTATDKNTPPSEAETPISKNWKVQSDPGPPPLQWPDKFPSTELRGVHPRLVVYPQGPTYFLLAGVGHTNPEMVHSFEDLLVGDIRTGKPIGPIIRGLNRQARPLELSYRPALSSDGQYVAFPHKLKDVIRIFATKTGQVKREIPLDRPPNVGLFFLRSDRLLVLDRLFSKKGTVFDLDTGQQVTTFDIPEEVQLIAGNVAISPGGRFLVLAYKENSGSPAVLVFIDTTTGEIVGQIFVGGRGEWWSSHVHSVAFSPDGNELAAVVDYPDAANLTAFAPHLSVWKLSTGREIHRVLLDTGGRGMITIHQSPDPLQWFPDQQAVLVNQQLVIRRTDGKLLDVVQAEGDIHAHYATKILDDTRVLTATHRQKLVIRTIKRK
ncbi:MAG: WD40 repeat domain-containing protein [Gemmatales bacterium]|nr:WD40 repeat domain-containing protein [Gemmatales bacterium]MDW8388088.1 WD40 repeat domain-containing protein [Gemmatales bacterium]